MGAEMRSEVKDAIHALGCCTTEEAAEILGCSRNAVIALVARGTLKAQKILRYVAPTRGSVEREKVRRAPPPQKAAKAGRPSREYGRMSYEQLLKDIREVVRDEIGAAFIDHAYALSKPVDPRWSGFVPAVHPPQAVGRLVVDSKVEADR